MIGKLPSGKYRVRIKYRGRVIASKTFSKKADAKRWEDDQRRRLESGAWVDPRGGDRRLCDVAETWLKVRSGQVASTTLARDRYAVRHWPPSLSNYPIGQITQGQIESVLGSLLSQGYARASVMRSLAVLSGVFTYAVKQQVVATNPCGSVGLPPGSGRPPQEVMPFTLGELRTVLGAQRRYSSSATDVTEFLALTGLRWGELRSLRVADVQQVPIPAIRVSLSHPDGHDEKETKGRRKRTVPLVPAAWAIASSRLYERPPSAYLFTSPGGRQLHESNWKRSVRWSETGMGRRVHDLRHPFATLALQGGLDVKTVQAWLGHASATLTLDLYGHFVTTDADRAGLDRLAGLLGTGDTTGTSQIGEDGTTDKRYV